MSKAEQIPPAAPERIAKQMASGVAAEPFKTTEALKLGGVFGGDRWKNWGWSQLPNILQGL
jgi:hypothetical protein